MKPVRFRPGSVPGEPNRFKRVYNGCETPFSSFFSNLFSLYNSFLLSVLSLQSTRTPQVFFNKRPGFGQGLRFPTVVADQGRRRRHQKPKKFTFSLSKSSFFFDFSPLFLLTFFYIIKKNYETLNLKLPFGLVFGPD